MKKAIPKYPRIFAVAPVTRGFGFAVLEGLRVLADWGMKSVTGDKNLRCVIEVDKMLKHYRPDVMVLENTSTKPSRRCKRIRALIKRLGGLAEKRGVTVILFSREQVRRVFFTEGPGTKYALAELIAKKFPDELSFRLPPKRRPWMSEDARMSIFDAIALGLMIR